MLTELEENGIGGGKIIVLKSLNCQWNQKTYGSDRKNNIKGKPIPKKCKLYYALDVCFKNCQKQLAEVKDFRKLLGPQTTDNRLGKFINCVLCQEENALLRRLN